MAWRFNPPPGWPAAPVGWYPPAGWQPDPRWPHAPSGWAFWVDDVTGQPYRPGAPVPPDAPAPAPVDTRAAERTRLRRAADAAEAFVAHPPADPTDLRMEPTEVFVWQGRGALVEPRQNPAAARPAPLDAPAYAAGDVPLAYAPGRETSSPSDLGRIVVSSRRVLFGGARLTREWRLDGLVGIDVAPDASAVLLRQRGRPFPLGLSFAPLGGTPVTDEAGGGPVFLAALEIAAALGAGATPQEAASAARTRADAAG